MNNMQVYEAVDGKRVSAQMQENCNPSEIIEMYLIPFRARGGLDHLKVPSCSIFCETLVQNTDQAKAELFKFEFVVPQ